MAKLTSIITAALVASASAFSPASVGSRAVSSLQADKGYWDPMGFYTLSEAADTFPSMFPKQQYLDESEIKHGRMAMLAWTGVWATTGLGWHFPGAPVEADWTKALGVFATEQPSVFGAVLALICLAEGESVGHSGDNFRGKSTKTPGNLNFDYLGLGKKLSPERLSRYQDVELKNGRAAMIAMASLFAFKSIPGSVPIMDLLGAQ